MQQASVRQGIVLLLLFFSHHYTDKSECFNAR